VEHTESPEAYFVILKKQKANDNQLLDTGLLIIVNCLHFSLNEPTI